MTRHDLPLPPTASFHPGTLFQGVFECAGFTSPQSLCSEKAVAPHSSVLVWRIPGTAEPAGLPSLGSHRVGHDWSDLAAAAAAAAEPLLRMLASLDSHTSWVSVLLSTFPVWPSLANPKLSSFFTFLSPLLLHVSSLLFIHPLHTTYGQGFLYFPLHCHRHTRV